ncbi:unnamed protein product [Acanthoscelides obtectus]|uniref:Ig-like domain-containing protein n=1 Tax=Acanthoscelides obtectus TaxID=200917 RepID=A0A9P0LAW9_ACAOB|nr:unnamed protein product [Acanthoscelides obtectus]CAK1641517.1 hypothetical protein AOBTE_LOCUS12458 [Acanthoscelides obtectus]
MEIKQHECWALKEVQITVPPLARSGDTVTLRCEYDLEEVALYSIKWYRGDEEFYRYIPKESPPFRAFPVNHVNVDVSMYIQFTRMYGSGTVNCKG